jgi:uncharacterized protein YqeY
MSLLRPTLLRTRLAIPSRQLCIRYSTTTTSEPTISVIRSLQAEIINASKTAKPIETDGALYSLIQKQIKGINTAIAEFENAKRDDLVTKEKEQLAVLEGYAKEIPKVEESEIAALLEKAVEGLEEGKRTFGSVMGRVMGAVKGRPVDMEYLNRKIEEIVGKK